MIREPVLVLAFMLAVVAFARWLEERYEPIRKISSAVVCTLLGITLANVGVIEHTGSAHEGVFTFAIPYAIVLVIMGTHMKELAHAGRPLLIAYLVACGGSLVGGAVAGATMAGWVGPETWKLAGAFSAAFAGGGMNFAAVGQGLEVEPSTFAAAALADNMSTVPYLLLQVWLAGVLAAMFLRRCGPGRAAASSGGTGAENDREPDEEAMRRRWTDTDISITDFAVLGALPLAALWVARLVSDAFGAALATMPEAAPLYGLVGFLSEVPEVLWLTTIALIVAQLPWVRKLRGAEVLSYFALHIFFIALGAASDLATVVDAGLPIFSFMIVIIGIHVVLAYGLGWLFRIDLPTVSIASQAAIGGPGSALAIGMAMKWHRLVAPAVIVGIFGYALGNYLGFACARFVNALLG